MKECLCCKKEILNTKLYKSEIFENMAYVICNNCGCLLLYNPKTDEFDDMKEYENTDMASKIFKDYSKAVMMNSLYQTEDCIEMELDVDMPELTEEQKLEAEACIDAVCDITFDKYSDVIISETSPYLKEETQEEHTCECGGECGGENCACHKEEIEVPKDIQHQIDKDFTEYLIISDEYGDGNDMQIFTGSKDELNTHLANLHLHSVPKVYTMCQLEVESIYKVK